MRLTGLVPSSPDVPSVDSARLRSPDPGFLPCPTTVLDCAAWRRYIPRRVASEVPVLRRALVRCHVADRDVPVLAVVPLHKNPDQQACILDALERLAWVDRCVLQRAEQALRAGVVIA